MPPSQKAKPEEVNTLQKRENETMEEYWERVMDLKPLPRRFLEVKQPDKAWPIRKEIEGVSQAEINKYGLSVREFFKAYRSDEKFRREVPKKILEVYIRIDQSRAPYWLCRLCTDSAPDKACEDILDAKDMQEICDAGARFIGDDQNPLADFVKVKPDKKAR